MQHLHNRATRFSTLAWFLSRLLLPYERHSKGEKDEPLPLVKPRKQEGGQEKVVGVKAKGAKKAKGSSSNPKQGNKKDREETKKDQHPSQVSHENIQSNK